MSNNESYLYEEEMRLLEKVGIQWEMFALTDARILANLYVQFGFNERQIAILSALSLQMRLSRNLGILQIVLNIH